MPEKSPPHENNLLARKPAQERTRLRFEALLDAADRLLLADDTSRIGLYDIAAAAGMPPASAYHLFPTKEAVFVALAQRYLEGLNAHIVQPFEPGAVESWQQFVLVEMVRAIDFYNNHPVMGKLFFGDYVLPEIRALDTQNVEAASASHYHRMNRVFHMPFVRKPELKFNALIGIYDGIWMTSYARHGRITEDFARETETAALAYCATFLPPTVPLRAPRHSDPAC
jgi:AcrR family transcriptional regulator